MRQTPPGSEPGESAGPSPGLETKMVAKKLKRREHITQVRGGSFSWILFPFIQKKETIFFGQEFCCSPQQESEAQQAWGQGSSGLTTGRPSSPHCLHQDARCAHPVHPPSRGLPEAARLCRSMPGAPEARGTHAPAPRRAAHIQLTRFLVPLLGGWQENYCTSDLGTWEGVGRGGTCPGNGAPVSLSVA